MAHQVALRLDTSSHIKAEHSNPVGGNGPESRQQTQRQPLFSLLLVPQEEAA